MPGIVGSCSYSERNLFGLNQKLAATVELGQVGSAPLPTPVSRSRLKKQLPKLGKNADQLVRSWNYST